MSTLLTESNPNQARGEAPDHSEKKPLDVVALPAPAAGELVQLFKLLADETRLQILNYLVQQTELNVGSLCQLLNQSQPAVSHHLALLRNSGVLEMRRDGKHNFYRIVPAKFKGYLDLLFSLTPNQAKKIRLENRVLSYSTED